MHSRLRPAPLGAVLRLPAHRPRGGGGARARRSRSCRSSAIACCRAPTMSSRSLSYANRRRVEIARALASRPKLLLLDEPTAGMNPAETLELADQIRSLNRLGLTIVLIEHKLDVVNNLADKSSCSITARRSPRAPPTQVHRNDEVIRAYLGTAGRSLLEFRGVDTYYGELHVLKAVDYRIEAGRDRLPAGRQCLRQIDDDEGGHGRRAADPRRHHATRAARCTGSAPPSGCRRGIAPVPEARRLFPAHDRLENLEMGAYTRSRGPEFDDRPRAGLHPVPARQGAARSSSPARCRAASSRWWRSAGP